MDEFDALHKQYQQAVYDLFAGKISREVFLKQLEGNPYKEEFLARISSSETIAQMKQQTEQAFKLRDRHGFEQHIRRSVLRRRIKSWSIAVSAAAAVMAAVMFLIPVREISNTGSQPLIGQMFTVPTLILNDSCSIALTQNNDSTRKLVEQHQAQYTSDRLIEQRLIVPSQTTYTITLPDQTEVTLDANSELRFPSRFSDTLRSVTLVGHAYFNVSKQSVPFRVNTADSYVKVYGTQFDVDMRSEGVVRTVLISGSVGVGIKNHEIRIKPNEMAVAGKQITVRSVDAQQYTTWIDGLFEFRDTPMSKVLQELSYWYGAEFAIKNSESLSEIQVNFSISRNDSLSDILKFLQRIHKIRITQLKENAYEIERL